MVDYCPDTYEYYWFEETDHSDPVWYHVVFFAGSRAGNVSRQLLKCHKIRQPFNITSRKYI